MKKISQLDQAIQRLKRKGICVVKLRDKEYAGKYLAYKPPMYCPSNNPLYSSLYDPFENSLYTARELIRWAKCYTSQDRQKTSLKKKVKQESKCERAFVRDRLRTSGEDADTNFPKSKYADVWNWD
jgi:hypothetical protein